MVIVKDFNLLLNRKAACSGLRVQVCPQCLQCQEGLVWPDRLLGFVSMDYFSMLFYYFFICEVFLS